MRQAVTAPETGTITPLTKSCLKLWRSLYGCRCGSYDAKPRVQIRDKKRRTAFAHLRREVLAAAHSTTILPRTAVPFSKYVGGAPPPGGPCQDLAASDLCTPGHSRFLRATKEKMRAAKVAMQKRSRGQNPFPATQLKHTAPSLPSLGKLAKVAMVTADQPGGAPARPHLSVQTGFDRCYTADIVVTDALAPCWVTVSCSP